MQAQIAVKSEIKLVVDARQCIKRDARMGAEETGLEQVDSSAVLTGS
jgi:hypothetical protein